LIREVADFTGVVDMMFRHYPLGDEWSDAIEGLQCLFDELRIEETLGEEEGLDVLARNIQDRRFDYTILDYGGAIAAKKLVISKLTCKAQKVDGYVSRLARARARAQGVDRSKETPLLFQLET
jgi:hypothetical protein